MKNGQIINIHQDEYRVIINKNKIKTRVRELAREIERDGQTGPEPPILLIVLTGGLYFGVDLSRELDRLNFVHHVDTVSLKSYNGEQGGQVRLVSEPHANLQGRHIIVVEDIIDRGDSMNFLDGYITALKPLSICYCTFLLKKKHGPLRFIVDYCGFKIDDGWIGGYGMDLDQSNRGLYCVAVKVG